MTTPPDRHPDIFTAEEAAAYLHMEHSPHVIETLREKGLLIGWKPGKEYLYHRRELDTAVERGFSLPQTKQPKRETGPRLRYSSPPSSKPLRRPFESDTDRKVSIGEAARILGQSTSWVRARADTGDIPYFRLGCHRKFRVRDLTALLEKSKAYGEPVLLTVADDPLRD